MSVYEVNQKNTMFATAIATAAGVMSYKLLAQKIPLPRIVDSLPRGRVSAAGGMLSAAVALMVARRFLRTDLGFSHEDLCAWDDRPNKQVLEIDSPEVTDAGLAFLRRRYPNVQVIVADVSMHDRLGSAFSNVAVTTCDPAELATCRPEAATPEQLDTGFTVRSFEDLAYVAQTVLSDEERLQITKLSINRSGINDAQLPKVLEWFPNVKVLHLAGTAVTLDGLAGHVKNLAEVGLSARMIEAAGGLQAVWDKFERSEENLEIFCWFDDEKTNYNLLIERVLDRLPRSSLDFSGLDAVAISEVAQLVSAPEQVKVLYFLQSKVTAEVLSSLLERFTAVDSVVVDVSLLTGDLKLPQSVKRLYSPVEQVDMAGGGEALQASCPSLAEVTLYHFFPPTPAEMVVDGELDQWLNDNVGNRPDRTKLDLRGRILSLEDLKYVRRCLHDPASITEVNLEGTGLSQADWDALDTE